MKTNNLYLVVYEGQARLEIASNAEDAIPDYFRNENAQHIQVVCLKENVDSSCIEVFDIYWTTSGLTLEKR